MNKCPRRDLNQGPSWLKERELPTELSTTDMTCLVWKLTIVKSFQNKECLNPTWQRENNSTREESFWLLLSVFLVRYELLKSLVQFSLANCPTLCLLYNTYLKRKDKSTNKYLNTKNKRPSTNYGAQFLEVLDPPSKNYKCVTQLFGK
jgi:hypothetical protein